MRTRLRVLGIILLLCSSAWAGVIEDVKSALAKNDFTSANSILNSYRAERGADPEYAEALSWMARGALSTEQLNEAEKYAQETQGVVLRQLKQHQLDSETHLPIALGAALEVQALTLARQNQRAQAIALLRRALVTYGKTSIRERLQKNLNILTLTGQNAPPLFLTPHLGPTPLALDSMKGSVVLMFFWAHWCGDCKAEAPIIARLRSEFSDKELRVVGPTRLYGYAGQQEGIRPEDEMRYIEAVRQRYYSGLLDIPVPVRGENFDRYGASTTPTLVLVDRAGRVALYHPGAMPYEELKAAIDRVTR